MSDIAISSRSCTERHGDFSVSVVFHSFYEVSCFLFVVWLGCLVFVLVVCWCWLLLGGWMGDTLGLVSLSSHAWEWTISTNRLMTVRASSAHGTGKKKNRTRSAMQEKKMSENFKISNSPLLFPSNSAHSNLPFKRILISACFNFWLRAPFHQLPSPFLYLSYLAFSFPLTLI